MSYFAHISKYSIPATWEQFRELPFPTLSHKATPHTDKLICQVYYHYRGFFGLLVYALITKQLKVKEHKIFYFFFEATASFLSVTALI